MLSCQVGTLVNVDNYKFSVTTIKREMGILIPPIDVTRRTPLDHQWEIDGCAFKVDVDGSSRLRHEDISEMVDEII